MDKIKRKMLTSTPTSLLAGEGSQTLSSLVGKEGGELGFLFSNQAYAVEDFCKYADSETIWDKLVENLSAFELQEQVLLSSQS